MGTRDDVRGRLLTRGECGERRGEIRQPGDAAPKLQNRKAVFHFHQTSFSLTVQEKKAFLRHIYGIMVVIPEIQIND